MDNSGMITVRTRSNKSLKTNWNEVHTHDS